MERSDLEIRNRLKFTQAWYDLGIVDEQWVEDAIRIFREGEDHCDEHYRYGAFASFLRRSPKLTARECESLMELGANDPDRSMGTTMMLDVLRRPECPEHLFELAHRNKRTCKYAEKLWNQRPSKA